jgi:mannitol-1-phosphate 5-dehydrogenase
VKKTLATYTGLAENSAEVTQIETLYNQLWFT